MKCPSCNAANLHTIATRKQDDKTFRIKKCKECGEKHHSLEMVITGLSIPHKPRGKV